MVEADMGSLRCMGVCATIFRSAWRVSRPCGRAVEVFSGGSAARSPRRLKVGCGVRLRPTDFDPIHYSAGISLRVMGGREHYSYRNRTRRICCFPFKESFFFLTSNKLLNKCLKCLRCLEVLLGTFRESTGTAQWTHSTVR